MNARMHRVSAVLLLVACAATLSALAADPNVSIALRRSAAPAMPGPLCGLPIIGNGVVALALIDQPLDSFNIRFTVQNCGTSAISHVILDSFRALGRESLLQQSVFDLADPQGGTLTVDYPTGDGQGPVVLVAAGFDPWESIAFNTDPDTYDDPAFGAVVSDLAGTRVEVVFQNGTRGDGTMRLLPLGVYVSDGGLLPRYVLALITQTSP